MDSLLMASILMLNPRLSNTGNSTDEDIPKPACRQLTFCRIKGAGAICYLGIPETRNGELCRNLLPVPQSLLFMKQV
jgi:hypothetical protein